MLAWHDVLTCLVVYYWVSEWILLSVAFCTIMAISRQKEVQSWDCMPSMIIYSAQYHRQYCTPQAFEQIGALHIHNLDDRHPIRTQYLWVSSHKLTEWAIKAVLFRINPLGPHDALKDAFTSRKRDLIFIQLSDLQRIFPWNWFANTWQFSLIFKPHQIIFIHYKSRMKMTIKSGLKGLKAT